MTVKDIIEKRRSFRSLEPFEVTDEIIKEIAEAAKLAPSCYNKQPWRFVFVRNKGILEQCFNALKKGNEWCWKASLLIAVYTHKNLDCIIKNRKYANFDTGMATAFMILRATEMGLVMHPIAGFKNNKTKEILKIPDKMKLITILVVGKKADEIDPDLNEKQQFLEEERAPRLEIDQFVSIDRCSIIDDLKKE